MSILNDMKNRQIQKKANNFIASLKKKNEKEIEQAYLDNKELANNEIVLSYLFFNHPSLIRILPLEFQKSRINSNLTMFNLGSKEAKKELVSSWIHANKFFMNALVVGFDEEECNNYLKLYFNQPEDVALLYMEDLKKVVTVLASTDIKQTQNIIEKIKDKLTDKQWEYILEVDPIFIKYANQNIQNRYTDKEEFITYLNGEAREKYINNQIDKLKNDFTIFNTMNIDIQKEYIKRYPYMINYINDEELIKLLKYDIELIKYVNLSTLKNKEDKTQEVVCGILENIETVSSKELVNILVNKCLLNAKGKLYRFDTKSNDISYQYTKRIIKLLQELTIDQITSLINVDVNYILPYVVPLYNKDEERSVKEKIIIDSNYRCLNVFKNYYGEKLYSYYYKVINKIYNVYIDNMDEYDYEKDYNCIFELFKILFNKKIMTSNTVDKISVFVGTSILYKDKDNNRIKLQRINILNEILSNAYKTKIKNNKDIFNINSLELFDSKLSFIDKDLLQDFSKYNFVNISNLLLIIKSDKMYNLFKEYYFIMMEIYGKNKESLYKTIENFTYYKDILIDIKDKELTDEETENLILLLSSGLNQYNITKKEELSTYDTFYIKKIVNELSDIKDENVYKNLLCKYLFNKSYDEKGNTGWLEVDTIKNICDVYDVDTLKTLVVDGNNIFDEDEVNLFSMTKLLFSMDDFDLILSFLNNVISNKVKRNIFSLNELFNKIKEYKVELINNMIVSLDEIKELYNNRPDLVIKNEKDGAIVYTIVGQDFKVLTSTNDDGIHYLCTDVSSLDKNTYGYNKLIKNGSIRFTTNENKTIIKVNKDNIEKNIMRPEFIIVVGVLSDELLSIAKNNNLVIVEVQNG